MISPFTALILFCLYSGWHSEQATIHVLEERGVNVEARPMLLPEGVLDVLFPNGMPGPRVLDRARSVMTWRPGFTDEGLKVVTQLRHLESLTIDRGHITGPALAAAVDDLPHLTGLYVDRLVDADTALPHVAKLRHLTWLNIRGSDVTDRGLASLAGMTHLRHLELSETGIGDEGLAPVGTMSGLREFYVWNTSVTDAGLHHLARLPLVILSISGTKITDAGLPNLEQIKTLYLIDLRGTGVTRAGEDRLRKAVPNAEHVYTGTIPKKTG